VALGSSVGRAVERNRPKGVAAKEPRRTAGVDGARAIIGRNSFDRYTEAPMHSLIYIVGLIVVVLAVLSLFGLA